ncbi:hypothetical protein FXV83_07470 [Bradyrhizobium hipponense]|uniref:Uncharacterized protein n=1 Tax=Bradyrhizobium hipponense TaxID=2605638 RepID=A0A5S4YXB9_9BRAD|nr:hypothetical protein FXV83_07470 [Bradyrhizobium hipponense]
MANTSKALAVSLLSGAFLLPTAGAFAQSNTTAPTTGEKGRQQGACKMRRTFRPPHSLSPAPLRFFDPPAELTSSARTPR